MDDYIVDFVPPSPTLDPALDFLDSIPITSPQIPHTSSYNGSYCSPYSQHSELSFSDNDIQLQDFPVTLNDYEPSDYDAPNQPVSLLMFTNDSDYMSPSFPHNSFDYSSPSSNASGVDDNNTHLDDSWLSRPSSAASNHPSPQPTFHTSPRLSVDFGNMSVHTVPLPQHSSGLFPVQKAQSPPRLSMSEEEQNIPTIHAPNEDTDMMNGPQFCIVPATPVSGGGAGRANVPFQTTLSTLTQGSELAPSVNHQQSPQQQQLQRDPSPSTFPGTEENSGTSTHNNFIFPNNYSQPPQQQQQQQLQRDPSPSTFPRTEENSASSTHNNFIFPNNYSQPPQQQQRQRDPSPSTFPRTEENSASSTHNNADLSGFIFPNNYSQPQQQQHQSRPRTLSDPWNPNVFSSTGLENANVANEAAGAYDSARHQLQTFTFGGPPSTSNNFLSPDSLRRSVSDGKYHRPSRSEHIRSPVVSLGGHNASAGYKHQQSHSIGGSTAGFWPPGQQQYLHPSQVPATTHHVGNPNLSSNNSPTIGHFRRASLSARSDRGAEVWGSQGHHSMTPRRMSPYYSPNASPGARYRELDSDLTLGGGTDNTMGLGMGMGDPPVSAGFSEEIALSRRGSYAGLDVAIGGSQKAESIASGGSQPRSKIPSPSQADILPSQIPKVNVTTGRTANASHRRRKQDANFACNVPGCGSTFTRGFNLKGHLRSHYDLKPYKCHWPGCGKGFARQHDCKRHEQLHNNFRPFECEGCKKQFARMDALNRHLKSDAGVECARVVEGEKGVRVNNGVVGYGMGMSMGGGMLSMEPEEQKYTIPRRRQSGGGGGGGADSWSGVAL